MEKMRPNISTFVGIAVVLYFLVAVAAIAFRAGPHGEYEGDFSMYYWTAKAYEAGIDPYDRKAVEAMSGRHITQFYYFPLSIHVFRPFTRLPHNTARILFLLLQCVMLVYVVCLWQRVFLREPTDTWFLLFCLLAFNASIYADLATGNVAIIEQAFLWTAFYCFLRNQPVKFAVFLALASIFKIVLLFFLLLIPFARKDQRLPFLAALGGVGTTILVFTALTDAELAGRFVFNLPSILSLPSEQGIINPSSLAFFKTVRGSLTASGVLTSPGLVQWPLYICWVVFVFAVSWRFLRKTDGADTDNTIWAINFLCLVLALVSPRFKDYSYMLLLVPTYFLLKRTTVIKPYHLGFILCILSVHHIMLPGLRKFTVALWIYYPLALALLVWIAYVLEFCARKTIREASSEK